MRRIVIAVLLFFSINVFSAENPSRSEAISEALHGLKMRERDLSVLSSLNDPFRFSLVDSLMNKPLEMPATLDSLGVVFTDPKMDELEIMGEIAVVMDLESEKPVTQSTEEEYPWQGQRSIPVKIRQALDLIFAAYEKAEIDFAAAFSEIDSFQMDTIARYGVDYLVKDKGQNLDDEKDDLSLEELDNAALEKEELDKRIFSISSRVNLRRLFEASSSVMKAALSAEGKLEGLTAQSSEDAELADTLAHGDIIYLCMTRFGPVVIGGPKQTVYESRFAVIIDLGGDDIYQCAAGGADSNVPFAIAIDLDGDDLYSSKSNFAFGSGGLGIGILIDINGSDIYRSRDFGLGSAAFGTGFLIDRAGDDLYVGRIGSQGAAFIGIGVLRDYSGNDTYLSSLYSQGFGYVGGFGMIADIDGNDSYTARGEFVDRVRYADHHLSLCQGFGYGKRPNWSGGIGLLFDGNGYDTYNVDIFGQGASYWFGFGGLWDRAGNDSYTAYQYAQGSGVHQSAAIIYDLTGEDSYLAHGVSQGSGHDLAVGYLLDFSADDDNYIVFDLSQGAGNANGVGIFIDEGGDDGYMNKNEYNVQGYGNWRRDFGSIGIMLDLSGNDRYSAKGEDSSWWSSGKYGLGIDFPASIPEEGK